ncbi:putative alpha-glucan, water dikinase [Rosa chinensis]|uniref:Putative alpha-glucan, water dikinase n=1 Tax=Rosa chinensis TaxID=74649 RepID=A0A2P6PG61_ROSCH|nr:putative alpha-glucan, water dikinase [Rosa chinensis]
MFQKLLESCIERRPLLIISHRRLKDILFLDLALASAVETTLERGLTDLHFSNPPNWYRISELYKPNNDQSALQSKAIFDCLPLVLADRSQCYQKKIQPSAKYLGNVLGVQKSVIDTFSEELLRAGSETILSTLMSLINRFDPILRKVANLGW